MFLRSLLHRKNKKEEDCSTSPRKEVKADDTEVKISLNTDNLNSYSAPETNEDVESNMTGTAGCRDQATPSQNGNQVCTGTQQTPGTSAEDREFLTPSTGSREASTSSRKLIEGLVGQQGDGDYVEETSPRKSSNQHTDEEQHSSVNSSNLGHEGLVDNDQEIEKLVQDVINIVSRELMNEHGCSQDENTSPAGTGSKTYFHTSAKFFTSGHKINDRMEQGKTTSSFINKEKHFRRHPFKARSKSGISVDTFDSKISVPPPILFCGANIPEDVDNPLQSINESQERFRINDQSDFKEECDRRITGHEEKLCCAAEKLTPAQAAVPKMVSDHNDETSSDASVTEASQNPDVKTEQSRSSFHDGKEEDVQITVLHQGLPDVRSKSRIGNVLACRFEENNGSDLPSPSFSDACFKKTDSNQFREICEKDRPGYQASNITMQGSIVQNASTDASKPQSFVKYYVTDPPDSSHDAIDASYDITDLSYETTSETDWSKVTDYSEQDDEVYDGNYDVFLPDFLEDFVITPCEDSDTEDGDEFFLEETPREPYETHEEFHQTYTTLRRAGPREDESNNQEKEEDNESDPEMKDGITVISGSRVHETLSDKPLNLISSPTDELSPRRQSKEENLEDMEKWVQLRRRQMEKGINCLLEKFQSRAEKVESSLKREILEFKEKALESTDNEDYKNEDLTGSENVGETFLMDNLLKSVFDQHDMLLSSLRTTEERTRLFEMQLEQWEVGEEDRKEQIVSLRKEVEGATARQRSLTAMLNEERRLKEALQLRLAALSQEKQQLLYNNVMLWEQTSQMELKQEHFQSVSAHERNELEEQMKALESELLELRSRKAGEPVKQISSESACSVSSDHHQGSNTPKPENDGSARCPPRDHPSSHNGPRVMYGIPPHHYGNDREYYAPVSYHYYHGQQRPNANNSGYPFAPPRFPPPFPRRLRPRGRGDNRNLSVYFDRLSHFYPRTWYPKQSREEVPFHRGRGGRPFRGRGFSRRGRERGYGRGRRGHFNGEHRN